MERFFRDLTVDCIRDGSFTSVRDLTNAIETYMAARDLEPTRYATLGRPKAPPHPFIRYS
ncbi:MAG: hypothetical protein J6386_08970 [Candidatus Synoicihabitans palmerolidicus]|nr:hypothetical protein [Candidatus Synoicihabitans palmerolidicus]